MVDWDYFDRFGEMDEKYLPSRGEGETMATQIATAVAKLVYKWYNDGDVFDNVHSGMIGWANNLSSYANWLHANIPECRSILERIYDTSTYEGYEEILKDLCDLLETPEKMAEYDKKPKTGSVYDADGPFKYDDYYDEPDYGDEDEDE